MDGDKRTRPLHEEVEMIRDAILIPFMIQMVEKNMKEVEYQQHVLKRAFLMTGQTILDLLTEDQVRIRRELLARKIRLDLENVEVGFSGSIHTYSYLYRGYQDKFGMTRDVMRYEISFRLAAYTSRAFGKEVQEGDKAKDKDIEALGPPVRQSGQ
ncbi:hypothetical protein ACTHPH_21985 [Paenibacillus pasadenensis]|uniref:hypothetical protein n=1 Tax=Paenibacillus pasadenensis TaxID=217090 RepID=UPI00048AAE35|nr:hypothetical protein [Paenibacillus pasadenensis]